MSSGTAVVRNRSTQGHADVLFEQIQVEESKRHVTTGENIPGIGIVMFALYPWSRSEICVERRSHMSC